MFSVSLFNIFFIKVVLPQPFSPIIAAFLPFFILKFPSFIRSLSPISKSKSFTSITVLEGILLPSVIFILISLLEIGFLSLQDD